MDIQRIAPPNEEAPKREPSRVVRRARPGFRDPRKVAAMFASAVTTEVGEGLDFVAMHGPYSLFRALQLLLPQVIQPITDDGHRYRLQGRISRAEFNKIIQAECGFQVCRSRRKLTSSVSCNWIFRDRRWLLPSDPSDHAKLLDNYAVLCATFPDFHTTCPASSFLSTLYDITTRWAHALATATNTASTAQTNNPDADTRDSRHHPDDDDISWGPSSSAGSATSTSWHSDPFPSLAPERIPSHCLTLPLHPIARRARFDGLLGLGRPASTGSHFDRGAVDGAGPRRACSSPARCGDVMRIDSLLNPARD
mmetsp:Transcript_63258/g.169110  ORF Transcript_63258/g.169110 Transcript_63258/m.169110 type:complete len:309 (-) Transcript_63258:1062-1988(-)